MKTLLTLILSVTILLSLPGQSNSLKIGGTYRNSNYLSHTGNQKVGLQLGYSYAVSDHLMLAANLGVVSNHWDVNRNNVRVFREEDRTTYLEAGVLFPILRSNRLKGGIGYVGSRNTFDYAETAVISNQELESITANSLTFYLHELGLLLEYSHPISNHLVLYAGTNLSASLNQAPAYQSIIDSASGISRSLSSVEERNVIHYRLSAGIGYVF